MRILHVIPTVANRDGGPSRAVIGMCREANRRGAHAEIFTTNLDGPGTHNVPCGVPVDRDGVQVTHFPVAISGTYKISPMLASALRRKIPSCDVAHIHSLYQFPSTAAAFYCRKFGVPYILRPHGTLDPYLFSRHRGRKLLYELLIERRNLRCAAAVHFVTEEERRLAAQSKLLFNPVVVPFGIDFDDLPALRDRTAMEAEWPETRGRHVILFLGRVNFKKGLDILAKAFGTIARSRCDVVLLVAGPDNEGYASRVRGWLQEEGVQKNTVFTGLLTGRRKVAVLAGASLFVLPSYTENLGVAVVEAMAAGLPVVISRHVNICREVADAHAGFVTDNSPREVAAAILRLIEQPELALTLGKNGRRLALSRFSWDFTGPRLMHLYADVAAKRIATNLAPARVPTSP